MILILKSLALKELSSLHKDEKIEKIKAKIKFLKIENLNKKSL